MNSRQSSSADPEPGLFASLGELPRPAWILFFGTFLNKFGAFVVPFLTLYLTRQGYSLGDAGLAIGAYGLGHLLASVLGGHLADTFGRRKTIVLSMFSAAFTMMLLSQARGLPMIIALAALAGLAGELYRPAASALLTDLISPGQRVTAFSAYRIAFNAGWAFGPATAGFLAGHGFFWLFVGDAATSFLYGLLALFALPRGLRSSQAESGWADVWQVVRRDRRFLPVLLAVFAIGLGLFQLPSTFGVQVTQLGFSAATYGAILSMNGLIVVLCELPMTRLTRRFAARRVIAIGYLLIGVGLALIAFARSVPALVGCVVVLTVGEMIAMPVVLAYIANLAPPTMRGRYMGMHVLTWGMGLTLGPALGMKLFGVSPTALWLTCGGLSVAAAVIISLGRRSSESTGRVMKSARP